MITQKPFFFAFMLLCSIPAYSMQLVNEEVSDSEEEAVLTLATMSLQEQSTSQDMLRKKILAFRQLVHQFNHELHSIPFNLLYNTLYIQNRASTFIAKGITLQEEIIESGNNIKLRALLSKSGLQPLKDIELDCQQTKRLLEYKVVLLACAQQVGEMQDKSIEDIVHCFTSTFFSQWAEYKAMITSIKHSDLKEFVVTHIDPLLRLLTMKWSYLVGFEKLQKNASDLLALVKSRKAEGTLYAGLKTIDTNFLLLVRYHDSLQHIKDEKLPELLAISTFETQLSVLAVNLNESFTKLHDSLQEIYTLIVNH